MKLLIVLFCILVHINANENNKEYLSKYKYNNYSQHGEDGIIQTIFEYIGNEVNPWAIEFGAWDGFHLSNTAILWSKLNWNAVLIEGNIDKFNDLLEMSNQNEYLIYPINAIVSIEENSLESILIRNNINRIDFDLLSIDIDSDDYYVFDSLNYLRPRVIICEYNPTIPYYLDIYPEVHKNNMGCSVSALNRIGIEKGYTLVSLTDSNCIFVLNKFIPLLEDYFIWDLDQMKYTKYLQYKISDFSGKSRLIGDEGFIDSYKSLNTVEILDGNLYGKFKDITDQKNNNFIIHELELDFELGETIIIPNPNEENFISINAGSDYKKGTLIKVNY